MGGVSLTKQDRKPENIPALSPADKGKAFEQLALEALKAVLLHGENERLTRILHNVRLTGASGVKHQIDLQCLLLREGVVRHFLVECKNQLRPVSQEKVSAFHSVLLDLDLPGIMISSSGYQFGALQYARHAGIILLELRPPREKDWNDYVRCFLQAEKNAETITAPRESPGQISRTAHASNPDLRSRTSDQKRGSLTDLEVIGYSNLRIHMIAESNGHSDDFPPPTAEDLAYEPGLMILKSPNGKVSIRMDDLIRSLRADPSDLHPVISLPTPGYLLHHLIRKWKLPLREIRFEFDNLTPDFRDTILYGAESPSLLLINHSDGSRRNLRVRRTNSQARPLISAGARQPHPVHEIRQHPSARIPGPEDESQL